MVTCNWNNLLSDDHQHLSYICMGPGMFEHCGPFHCSFGRLGRFWYLEPSRFRFPKACLGKAFFGPVLAGRRDSWASRSTFWDCWYGVLDLVALLLIATGRPASISDCNCIRESWNCFARKGSPATRAKARRIRAVQFVKTLPVE
jgi:hypothetical protein